MGFYLQASIPMILVLFLSYWILRHRTEGAGDPQNRDYPGRETGSPQPGGGGGDGAGGDGGGDGGGAC